MTEVEAAFPEASKEDKLSSVWRDRNVGLRSNGKLNHLVFLRVDPLFRYLILYLN